LAASVGDFFFHLDLLTILTAFAFLTGGAVTAGVFAISQGILVDLFSQGHLGLFPLLYLTALGCMAFCRGLFELHHPKGQLIIVTTAEAVLQIVNGLTLRVMLSEHGPDLGTVLHSTMISATITGVAAPVVFFVLGALPASWAGSAGDGRGHSH